MQILGVIALGLLALRESHGALDSQGVKCGQKQCTVLEYCSPYDTHCRPCSEACDLQSRNYQPRECAKDCQEYLHDQRYALRSEFLAQYEDLRGDVETLRVLTAVSITITCLSLLAILYLLGKVFARWEKLGRAVRRVFTRKWVKNPTNNNKVQDDAEAATGKQNGLKLTMPTISATVAPSHATGNGSVSGNGNSNSNSNSNSTPNTTSTPLSRRHPSEDTTLDYAYDNPAMTPSPEAAQLRTKRESSF